MDKEVQLERLTLASIVMNKEDLEKYLAAPDTIECDKEEIPLGYKRCGKCTIMMKLYLFNKNNGNKSCCTGNCKECQKKSSKKSYEKTKAKVNYKEYYKNHREEKLASNKKYYEENKEARSKAHKKYRESNKGKQVMKKAHAKRREMMRNNVGVPYKREWVIDRDKLDGEFPICYICEKPIKHEEDIQLDHVIPVLLGGNDCFTNIACTHRICNLTKAKDGRDVEVEYVESVIDIAKDYIDRHPALFEGK